MLVDHFIKALKKLAFKNNQARLEITLTKENAITKVEN